MIIIIIIIIIQSFKLKIRIHITQFNKKKNKKGRIHITHCTRSSFYFRVKKHLQIKEANFP